MKIRQLLLLAILIFTSCNKSVPNSETVFDNISHIEDKIHYEVPRLERLCDSLELIKIYIDIGECKLFCEIEGEGTPLVLINGGPGGTHHYFHPWFTNVSKHHKIIYYDQRGTGLSDFKKGEGYSFNQAIEDLEKLRLELGIQKWIVCGYSYGGGLAQRYALKYKESVLGMILISSLPMLPNETFNDDQEKFMSSKEKDMKNRIIKEYVSGKLEFKPFLYNLSKNGDWKRQKFHKPSNTEMIRSALYEWVNDDNFNKTMSESYSKINLKDAFNNFSIPTLIFEGNQDLTWGSAKADIFINNHPKAKAIKFDKAGHNLFVDKTDAFVSELLKFTSKLKMSLKKG